MESVKRTTHKTVETETLALHKGNFARYRIRPAEFGEWQKVRSAG